MSLFQKAPATPEESALYGPLEIGPDKVLEMNEEEWYEHVYRGDDVPQLTIRAVLMGSFLGFFLAFTNLYIGLKTGWGLGVAITACILSYALWGGLLQGPSSMWRILKWLGVKRSPMTILENNCMQSTASAAGYSTGGTMVSAIAALLMLSVTPDNPKGEHLGWVVLASWTIFLAAFGTVLAIPMKRNMINKERLKFPSGTAAAITLQSLYSEGSVALKKARALFIAAGIGAIFPLLIDFKIKIVSVFWDPAKKAFVTVRESLISGEWHIFDWFLSVPNHLTDGNLKPYKPSDWTMVWDVNPVMMAAGGLVGLRIGIYMLIGGLALIFGVGEWGINAASFTTPNGETVFAISHPGKAWRELGLWLGVPIMLSYGLLQFATQWKTIVRALGGFGSRNTGGQTDALATKTEVPFSWFAVLLTISATALIWTANAFFDIPIHFGLLAIFLTFFLALVAARATGESDITPVGAMGKIMQLTFGSFIPSGTANLMSASITANGAGCCADLLNDLKSGYLLGANPRRQFLAQMMGILAGTAATVTGFYWLVPDATALLGTDLADGTFVKPDFPAPAAQAWKAVADVMTGGGFAAMHPLHAIAIQWGLAIGALCLALEKIFPKKSWVPSATGLGLGLILPFQYPLSMAMGAFIAWIWGRKNKENFSTYMVPVAAGMIAGISLMGVLVALGNTILFGG